MVSPSAFTMAMLKYAVLDTQTIVQQTGAAPPGLAPLYAPAPSLQQSGSAPSASLPSDYLLQAPATPSMSQQV